jgi:CDP-diacylglycerol---glycerol-3-phosphate 3-phosphatidyltransferase
MSASRQETQEVARGTSLLSMRAKQSGRAILNPVIRLAMALGLTPNAITVIGLGLTVAAALLIGNGLLLAGAGVLLVGSVLDAVDGGLARATGGGTPFGGFLDSTLDRSGEAIAYTGIGAWLVTTQPEPTLPMIALLVAMAGSFLVSYAHARAQGIGLAADVGLAPRTERLVLVIIGVALAAFGFVQGLIGVLVILAALTVVTVIQRIRHVWLLSQAVPSDSKEN